jgi:hypothetical protein
MALVRDISETTKDRQSVHEEVDCLATSFSADGEQYLQLETFGTSHRKIPGKVSQSFQLNRESAAKLKKLIEKTFLGL